MQKEAYKPKVQYVYQLDAKKLNNGVYCIIITIQSVPDTQIINKIIK
jgi:hypothetical protein